MMIRPSKHSHPDQTIINLSLLLVQRLKKKRVEDYDKLRAFAKEVVSGGEILYLPSLNVLFLLGLVEYRQKTDAFEYVGPNEIN